MYPTRSIRWPLAALLVTLASSGHAVNIGISPNAGPVVNPFTGQETSVWKLVGYSSGCTAFQITPEWVMSSLHCAAGATSGYLNGRIAPGVEVPLLYNEYLTLANGDQWRVCAAVTEPNPNKPSEQIQTDLFICRLSDPQPFAAAGPFPPLVAGPIQGVYPPTWPTLPTYQQLAQTGAKYGSLMLGGRAGPDLLAFIGFNGLPYGYSPITDPAGSTIPELVGGDSGGAMFSFSPITGKPAFAGITTHPLQFLTEGTIAFIKDHITQYAALTHKADAPPTSVSTLEHYGNTTSKPAADLSAPPVGLSLMGSNFTVRWSAAADPSVTAYNVTYGHDGAITGRATVSAAANGPYQLAIPTGNAANLTVCAQPVNPVGVGNMAIVTNRYPGAKAFTTPNCTAFDLRRWAPPAAPTNVALTSALDIKTRLLKVSASWAAPAPAGVVIASYRVNSVITYATGPKRSATSTTTTPSFSTLVPSGSTVCVSVTSVSDVGVAGSASTSVCKKAL
jgi:hypothetical protein